MGKKVSKEEIRAVLDKWAVKHCNSTGVLVGTIDDSDFGMISREISELSNEKE